MGTLFAISSAIRQPERIGGLFLLAVPVRPFVSFKATVASVKLMLGIAGKDATVAAMRSDSSVRLERGIWKYVAWTPRFVELLRETALTEKELHRLTVPTVAVQSNRDELVSKRSAAVLEKNPCIRVVQMPESGHFGYRGRDKAELLARFQNWIIEMEGAE
jgi:pimeloyl-ACP methyl ester carboxylesterase